jgi:hypothetical protein
MAIARFEMKGSSGRKDFYYPRRTQNAPPTLLRPLKKRGWLPFSSKARYSTANDRPGDARRMDRSHALTAPALARAGEKL